MNETAPAISARIWSAYKRKGIFHLLKRIVGALYPVIIEKPLLLPLLLVLFWLSGKKIGRYTLHKRLTSDGYLAGLLGMTTVSERAFLQWYCQELYRGKGLIVELGPFLGATTCPLCRGLAKNNAIQDKNRKIWVYDKFQCDEFMANVLGSLYQQGKIKNQYHPGDSFKPEFDRQTESYSSLIVLTDGDLSTVKYSEGPIELLFVDAMKDLPTANRIVNQFYPSLIPGVSLVIHQDFIHYWTSWIHLIQYDLRDVFEFVYFIPRSTSVIFRYIGGQDGIKNYQVDLDSFDDQKIEAAFAYSCSLVPPMEHPNILASKIMLYIQKGDLRSARLQHDRLGVDRFEFPGELKVVGDMLLERERQQRT